MFSLSILLLILHLSSPTIIPKRVGSRSKVLNHRPEDICPFCTGNLKDFNPCTMYSSLDPIVLETLYTKEEGRQLAGESQFTKATRCRLTKLITVVHFLNQGQGSNTSSLNLLAKSSTTNTLNFC